MEPLDTITPQRIVELAEEQAKKYKKDQLKTHQLRNVFGAISKMRTEYKKHDEDYSKIEMDLVMLKPKLAYAAGRQKAVRMNFYPFMKNAIDAVIEAEKHDAAVKNFFALMESVIAYHKFYEK